jgi:hypothetical protein
MMMILSTMMMILSTMMLILSTMMMILSTMMMILSTPKKRCRDKKARVVKQGGKSTCSELSPACRFD